MRAIDGGVAKTAKEGLGSLRQQHDLRDPRGTRLRFERTYQDLAETPAALSWRNDQRPQQASLTVMLQTNGGDWAAVTAAYDPKRKIGRLLEVLDRKPCVS